MDPQKALQILDNAASLAPLQRAEHIAVQQAVVVLRAALSPPPAASEAPLPPASAEDLKQGRTRPPRKLAAVST